MGGDFVADYEKSSKDLSKKEIIPIAILMVIVLVISVPIYKYIKYDSAITQCPINSEKISNAVKTAFIDTVRNEDAVVYLVTDSKGNIELRSPVNFSESEMDILKNALEDLSGCPNNDVLCLTVCANGDVTVVCDNPEHRYTKNK